MPTRAPIDIAILGGGCAGLSLGRELVRTNSELRATILEPRSHYQNDRTWCFWERPSHPLSALVSASWPAWRFSHGGDVLTHDGNDLLSYQCIRSDDFYADACAVIDASDTVELRTGVRVHGYQSASNGVRIQTTHGPVHARYVVDTRPPSASQLQGVRMFQLFEGVEVRTEKATFDCHTAGLMEDMSTESGAFEFSYVLPLGPTRALIEATRFAPVSRRHDVMHEALGRRLRDRVASSFDIIRRERGVIPMGRVVRSETNDPRVILAGTRGGAVRASTGYALLRIDRWARACVRSLQDGKGPIEHPAPPWWQARMDDLFLNVLTSHVGRAPEIFMAMARHVPPAAFVRFLSDRAGFGDIARVVAALPTGLFLDAALRDALPRPSYGAAGSSFNESN